MCMLCHKLPSVAHFFTSIRGYLHDRCADNAAYPHDSHADKRHYWQGVWDYQTSISLFIFEVDLKHILY